MLHHDFASNGNGLRHSDVLREKPLFGYRPMVYSVAGIAGLGFIVWGHHMFMSGMNPALGVTFMVSTMMIALPSAVKTFNWLGTIWGGKIQFTTSMLFALSFVSMFIIGGLSGIFHGRPRRLIFSFTIHISSWLIFIMSSSQGLQWVSGPPFISGFPKVLGEQ